MIKSILNQIVSISLFVSLISFTQLNSAFGEEVFIKPTLNGMDLTYFNGGTQLDLSCKRTGDFVLTGDLENLDFACRKEGEDYFYSANCAGKFNVFGKGDDISVYYEGRYADCAIRHVDGTTAGEISIDNSWSSTSIQFTEDLCEVKSILSLSTKRCKARGEFSFVQAEGKKSGQLGLIIDF